MNYEELLSQDIQCKKWRMLRWLSIVVIVILAVLSALIIKLLSSPTIPELIAFITLIYVPVAFLTFYIINSIYKKKYASFEISALSIVGLSDWRFMTRRDAYVELKSKQALTNYDYYKFFKAEEGRLASASETMWSKQQYKEALLKLKNGTQYQELSMYDSLVDKITYNLQYLDDYYIVAHYSSPTGKSQSTKTITLTDESIRQLESDPALLMNKSEYNKYLKEQDKARLDQKQSSYYKKVNNIIDLANNNKENLVNQKDVEDLDKLIASLFDRTVNSIKKIKSPDSEEWGIIQKFISTTDNYVNKIIDKNSRILEYYKSEDFLTLKNTCTSLMASQREFNEYIDEKVKSISNLFGTNVVRNETSIEDEYNYIHPYKKSITPFTAEVSANVFASAENNPLEYVVKYFYPSKERYPEQIQKLQLLVEELETLKEAKQIIENYKRDIQQYLSDVPSFIMENDEDGFYSRLGFATINENTLTVDYKFSYTSNGGKAQRSFTIPMTEDTIVKLIEILEGKLTMSAFTKEQRSLMTSTLRQYIKERDNYTCRYCGNSIYTEPNLLLEIDHIIPVAKGGCTEENNLQTLCWKCNRHKSDKVIV